MMGNRKLVIYLHLIWNIQDGSLVINSDIERPIYRCIANQINKLGCQVLAINGVMDHIHIVVKMRSTVSISSLVKQAKGVCARFVNDELIVSGTFRWRAGYGAFSISRWDLPMIINYVKKQKTHHKVGSLIENLE